MKPSKNDMARASVANGTKTADKAFRILSDLGFDCSTLQRHLNFSCPYGCNRLVRPDIRVTAPFDFYVECKSNGAALGTMYGKLWYTVDLWNSLGAPVVVVLETPNLTIKSGMLHRLRDLSNPNIEWVLMEDLKTWATRKLKAA